MKDLSHTPIRHPAFSTFLAFLCCFLCSFLSIRTATAQLSGTYTIGGEDGDYPSFSEAIDALEEEGISSAVTFQVQTGKYEEKVVISNIPGSSCSSPIMFEGAGTTQEEVVIQAPSGSEFTLQVNGVDGIIFRNLSIVRTIDVGPGTDCFTLEDNILRGSIVAKSSANARSNQHIYRNNHIRSRGIFKENEAPWDPNAPVFDQGLIIEGNNLSGGGITITGQEGFKINQNSISVSSQEGNGIVVTNSWYGLEISGNSLGTSADNYKGTAMVLNSGAAAEIRENNIFFGDGGFAMDISTGKSLGNELLIANNFLLVDGWDARGHSFYDPISNLVGMDITSNYENQVKIYHNSVHVIGQFENGPNYTLSLKGENNSFYLLNNLFVNHAFGGTGIIVDDPSVIEVMDYNSLNFESTSLFAKWGGQEIESLEEWKSVTGFDEHSISASPSFPFRAPSEEMIGAGIYLEEVPLDRYGQVRNDPPTIGAIEKALTRNPLTGIFTIGGEDPDFASFAEAFEAISSSGGIEDSIIFRVRPGEYSEQINIGSYGMDAKITIEGESGDSTDVVLKYPEGNVLDPEGDGLVLNGTRNFTLRNVTIASGIVIDGGSDLLFENNVIHGGINASEVRHDTYRNNLFVGQGINIRGPGHVDQGGNHRFLTNQGLVIQGNTFNVSGTAIDMYAEEDVIINDNIIHIEQDDEEGGATAIRVDHSLDIKEIKNNSITSNRFNTRGISLSGGFFAGGLPQEISNNRIVLLNGGTGISFNYSMDGSSSSSALVANNMVSINGNNGATGIAVSHTPNDISFFYNSLYLYGNASDSRAMYFGEEIDHDIHLRNNIFANLADGYVFVGEHFEGSPEKISSSDYNNLYTSGEILALWKEGAVAKLNEWQTQTGFDAHSISVDPDFESAENLIPENPSLNGAGIALAEVKEDFFGNPRNDPPTIGAVELGEEEPAVVVNAGSDKEFNMPINTVSLRATAQVQDGRFVSFRWEKVSGPPVTMSGQQTANVNLTDLEAGEYVFRFTATDNQGRTGSDEMTLTVKDNFQLPVVNAGSDRMITLPTNAISLSGIAIANGGSFMAFRWEKVSGPEVTMEGEKTANVRLSDLQEGEYVLRFSATDSRGVTASDEMILTVKPAEQTNLSPVVNVGSDKTLTLPNNSISLKGTGFDPDGRFVAFLWEKVSGPSVMMNSARTANVNLSDLQEGVYVFRFSGTDNDGATASDEMTLTVNAEPAMASQSNSISVAAYPNTFQHHINVAVQGAQPEEYQVEVYDMLGKVYYRGSFAGGQLPEQAYRIDLSDVNMEEGMYLIRIENRSRSVQETLKVVKGH